MLPNLKVSIGSRVTKLPGLSISVNDTCVGCGDCCDGICFVDAIKLEDGRATINKNCRGCGRCVTACKQNAHVLKIENKNYISSTIDSISKLVDIS
jgi:heterodisulfide reductase subunit A-like polyferredoxin